MICIQWKWLVHTRETPYDMHTMEMAMHTGEHLMICIQWKWLMHTRETPYDMHTLEMAHTY